MNTQRSKFVPETTDVHGPGVDFWHQPDSNDYRKLDEDEVRGRKDVRRRFLENSRKRREASSSQW